MILTLVLLAASSAPASSSATVYIADHADELIVHANQGWGSLGLNTGIHPAERKPSPLRIKDTRYDRGLGMHAKGEVLIDLAGRFKTFEAEVGVHWQNGGKGSVVCQVFVDDEKRFDSGVMKEGDSPKKVRVSVDDADELRLAVSDAGDGITCDAADWGDARLIVNPNASGKRIRQSVDIAPFGRVVTSDPKRMEGTKASRVEPMPAEDVFMSSQLKGTADGTYVVPVSSDGVGCIGLEWTEERFLSAVGLQFADGTRTPAEKTVELQIWQGQSAWQGKWVPIKVVPEQRDRAWTWPLRPLHSRKATQKVRWLFRSAKDPIVLAGLSANTTSRWATATIRIESRAEGKQGPAPIELYNGVLLQPADRPDPHHVEWDPAKPLRLTIRYAKTRRCKTDRTVLRLKMSDMPFGVAVEDVFDSGAVWLPHAGVFVAREPGGVTLDEYLRNCAGHKTVLERVREMPDQSFPRAVAKVHNPVQDRGPMMLSLACDDRKYVVDRDGVLTFYLYGNPDEPLTKSDYYLLHFPYQLRPSLGDGKLDQIDRHLEGRWLPIPVSTLNRDGISLRQRTYVAPVDAEPPSGAPRWLRQRAVCVVEWTLTNAKESETEARLTLSFVARNKAKAVSLLQTPKGAIAKVDDRLVALFDTPSPPLRMQVTDGEILLTGKLPAKAQARLTAYLPAWVSSEEEIRTLIGADPKWDAAVEAYWRQQLAPAVQIELPDKLLTDVIRASQVHCLLAARNEAGGQRVAAWTSADRYGPLESEGQAVIRGMDMMGHDDFARRSLELFIHRYHPTGYLTTGYTMMGTGWHLWTLAEYVDRSGDLDWLKGVSDKVARACRWIGEQHDKTKRLDALGEKVPEYGLAPAGVFADWGRFTFTTFQAAQYCAGLREAARVLGEIAHPEASARAAEAEQYRQDIVRAYRWTQARTPAVRLDSGAWIPAYPPLMTCFGGVGEVFPGEDGSRAWCKNAMAHQLAANGVLDPRSVEVGRMLDHMEDVEFLRGGLGDYPEELTKADFFNLGGFNKCQPYYRRNVELYAMRNDVKPFIRSYFNTLPSLLSLENLSLWEHFNNMGGWNKTH
ncbi:MAG: NPCBM/NEW2 domain-containing protein, partial [Phycisphaerae bacterium]|nr:NPCBM/NEW2 domain-containing protein [Phycisphaerae bacterium]